MDLPTRSVGVGASIGGSRRHTRLTSITSFSVSFFSSPSLASTIDDISLSLSLSLSQCSGVTARLQEVAPPVARSVACLALGFASLLVPPRRIANRLILRSTRDNYSCGACRVVVWMPTSSRPLRRRPWPALHWALRRGSAGGPRRALVTVWDLTQGSHRRDSTAI